MPESWALHTHALDVREVDLARVLILRLRRPSEKTLDRMGALLGVSLPTTPNTAIGQQPRSIWLAPDAWIIVGAVQPISEIEAAAEDASVLCVDASSTHFVVEIAGASARALIAKGCSLDLHPRVFGSNSAASTWMAQARVQIERIGDAQAFRLYFERNLRLYLRAWFEDALLEFKEAAVAPA